ncbi:hypothetical protein [Alteribacillus persepolensis]|uniref:hypothetical protein n=1 Tax=Alteribacillus persepolensis TaxID=568899 RepID=UPI001587641A|nr:hypothetical protein [Alteribacillus persepolensis]
MIQVESKAKEPAVLAEDNTYAHIGENPVLDYHPAMGLIVKNKNEMVAAGIRIIRKKA